MGCRLLVGVNVDLVVVERCQTSSLTNIKVLDSWCSLPRFLFDRRRFFGFDMDSNEKSTTQRINSTKAIGHLFTVCPSLLCMSSGRLSGRLCFCHFFASCSPLPAFAPPLRRPSEGDWRQNHRRDATIDVRWKISESPPKQIIHRLLVHHIQRVSSVSLLLDSPQLNIIIVIDVGWGFPTQTHTGS